MRKVVKYIDEPSVSKYKECVSNLEVKKYIIPGQFSMTFSKLYGHNVVRFNDSITVDEFIHIFLNSELNSKIDHVVIAIENDVTVEPFIAVEIKDGEIIMSNEKYAQFKKQKCWYVEYVIDNDHNNNLYKLLLWKHPVKNKETGCLCDNIPMEVVYSGKADEEYEVVY